MHAPAIVPTQRPDTPSPRPVPAVPPHGALPVRGGEAARSLARAQHSPKPRTGADRETG